MSIVNSQIYSNTAPYVRAHLQKFPSRPGPKGKIADALASTLTCTTAAWPMLRSTTGCTCHRDLQLSHRPICLAADMQFFPPFGIKSCSTSYPYVPALLANPHRPMGRLLTCLPRLTFAQMRPTLRSTTECMCRRDLNFSHRPDGKFADVLAPTHTCTTAIMLRSTTGGMCHRDLAQFPSPRWENG